MAQVLLQMYFLLTTISVVFTGMNCILFIFCVYVLWGQKSRSRRILLLCSIVQFCLSLAQTVLFVIDLSIAYTRDFNGVGQSHFVILSGYPLTCYTIYIVDNVIAGSLLIWRVSVLYNFKTCIPSLFLLATQVGFAGITAKGATAENVYGTNRHIYSLIMWSLIVAVNVSATTLICLRLWTARQHAMDFLSLSKYKSFMIVVVECGALVTICTVAMLILHAIKCVVGLAGLGITTQAATMAPLLIIARHGILSRRDDRHALDTPQIPLHISVVRTEDTRVDTPVEFVRKHRLRSNSLPMFSGGNHPKPFSDT
ncbi:hypothetical protein L210DRAFT_3556675 [Boletus edulis BED1]|uniref:Uncharacterized protein n=1 Tax=Boletus edulis BED1 TaxID=1328754 RepID=A0AAD4BL60_BOLED|nr:hypothetical protein L210DRAFT_3556675 [Boletus edulis BED1]